MLKFYVRIVCYKAMASLSIQTLAVLVIGQQAVLLSEINTISAFPIFPALAFSIKPDGLMLNCCPLCQREDLESQG